MVMTWNRYSTGARAH